MLGVGEGLYARVLGSKWNDLDETVRLLHARDAAVRATGTFRVLHGSSFLARCSVWAFRLPSPGDAVSTSLVISPVGDSETWTRRFDGRPLVTTQRVVDRGVLTECFGLFELRFQLTVHNGSLLYDQIGARLRCGRLSLPLPSWLAPHVLAREERNHVGDGVDIAVRITLPFKTLLIRYEGTVTRQVH